MKLYGSCLSGGPLEATHVPIAPVYTEHIGRQLLAHIESEQAA